MKKSTDESKNLPNGITPVDLEFPSGLHETPPAYDVPLEEILRLSEERLPLVNGKPDWWVERVAAKCFVPFEL